MAEENTVNSQNQLDNQREQEIPEVQNELSKVATNPKQSIMILVIVAVIFLVIFYKLFFSESEPPPTTVAKPTSVSKPIEEAAKNIPEIPKLPEAPKLQVPTELPPPPPVAKVELPPVPTPTPTKETSPVVTPLLPTIPTSDKLVKSEDEQRRLDAKRKSSIVLIEGVPPAKTPEQIAEEAAFVERGDMRFVLAHGKIIEAVLESAINSDFTGEVRAIISRDVFSEQGQIILIPKGSKVFGTYTTDTDGAYGRVAIIWNRIDLSNGYSINLDALSVDNLGKPGEQGRVDEKLKERLTNAILMSAFNIGTAHRLDKIVKPTINSQSAATNTAEGTNIQNLAQSFNHDITIDENLKIAQLCSSVQNAITNKTSTAFTSIQQACNTAQTTTGAQPGQRLRALITSVNNAAASLFISTAVSSTPTQAQLASKQAFTDITDTMKEFVEQQDFKTTITIDQGTVIKIYVKKDYKFPQRVLNKPKLIN
ncbi:MAG: TrbI/VirB10 family protein [Candidatus Rickettsia vulgarisii]